MRHNILINLCVIAALFTFSLTAAAKRITFNVSPNGSDKAAGTAAAPWQTIEHAVSNAVDYAKKHLNDEVVLIVADGNYRVNRTMEIAHYKGSNLIIKAEHAGKATLDGRLFLKKSLGMNADGLMMFDLNANGANVSSPVRYSNRLELYHGDVRQQISRYPNEGYAYISSVLGTTPLKYGAFKEGIIKYADKRISKYKSADGLYAFGYWHWDWSDDYCKVKSINSRRRTIELMPPYHYYGYKKGAKFCLLNAVEDIDVPGEYSVDESSAILYWKPLKDHDKGNLWISNFTGNAFIAVDESSNVVIDGLAFVGGRENGIKLTGGQDNRIVNCKIYDCGNNAIAIEGGKAHVVDGCYCFNLGANGIDIKTGDRKTLSNSDVVVSNTVIRKFAQYRRTMKYGVEARGCGITLSHLDISDSPAEAILFEGNNMTIEYSRIYDVVKFNTDNGFLDMYRNPSFRGIKIRNNYWRGYENSRDSVAAIRLDDMISGVEIQGNIFDRCGTPYFAAIQINGGRDNIIKGNLFWECTAVASFSNWSAVLWARTLGEPWMKQLLYEDVDIRSAHYRKAYPSLKNLFAETGSNIIADNIMYNCGKAFMRNYPSNRVTNNRTVRNSREQLFEKYGYSETGVKGNIYYTNENHH